MKQTIKARRKALRLSQRDLAAAINSTPQRISDLENLKFHPTDDEKPALSDALKCAVDLLIFRPHPPRKPFDPETTALVERFRCKSSYRAPRDRTGEARIYAALKHYADIMQTLKPLLDRAEVRQFADDAPFGSVLEFIKWLMRIDREGARPAEVAPVYTGYEDHPIVCPTTRRMVGHCQVSSLVTERWVAMLQVSVETPALYTMDALVCTFHEGTRYHFAVEIDGPSKPPPSAIRDQALGIPILRFTKAEILAGVGIGDKLDEYFAARQAG